MFGLGKSRKYAEQSGESGRYSISFNEKKVETIPPISATREIARKCDETAEKVRKAI